MPISKENQKLYPLDWGIIRANILNRAGNRCETCGVRNHADIYRHADDKEVFIYHTDPDGILTRPDGTPIRESEIPDGFEVWRQPTRVVLTISHTNHDVTDNRPGNLKALCQLHHLRHDAKHHAQNAAKTRRAKVAATTGQLDLFGGVE